MAQENKTALLKELSSCFAQLKQVDKSALKYLSKDLTQSIKTAKVVLTGKGSPSPKTILNKWFDEVVAEVKSEEAQLVKGTYQSFNIYVAKKYATITLNDGSKKSIINYIFGLVCSKISKTHLRFSAAYEVTTYVESIRTTVINEILKIGDKQGFCIETYRELPSTSFLAEKLLFLYVESTYDSWDQLESGAIKSGYIYFSVNAFFERVHLDNDEKNHMRSELKFIRTEDKAPYIDDIEGPENVHKVLKKYYNENMSLVYLPMKMKAVVTINVSEVVGSGSPNVSVGGGNGYSTIKCEREINQGWKLITKPEKGYDLVDFYNRIDEHLDEGVLSQFKIKDLVND